MIRLGDHRHGAFLLSLAVLAVVFWGTLAQLAAFTFEHEHYSHIALIPLVTGFFLYQERRRIFAQTSTNWIWSAFFLILGAAAFFAGRATGDQLSQTDHLSVLMLSLYFLVLAAFLLCYGMSAFRAGRFLLLFLILAVPIPDSPLHFAIRFLQYQSADMSALLFDLVGVPVFRDGLDFYLSSVTIRVAEECSGIRSSLALLITALLAAYLFLRSAWARMVLVLSVVPLAILKNGIRIVTLTTLSVKVDPGFLSGDLHQQGGFVFFTITLVLLGLILWALRWGEKKWRGKAISSAEPPDAMGRVRTPIRVCMLTYSFYDSDNRVMRYAETLAGRGNEVEVLSLRGADEPAESVVRGVRISRIQRRVRDEMSRRSYALKIILFFLRAMLLISFRHLRRPYQLIHVHSMPDFLVFAAWLPKIAGAKLALDIHDLLPEMYADKFRDRGKPGMSPLLLQEERLSCRFADHVIVANHLWAERLTSRSVLPEKCTAILNYPDRTIFSYRGPKKPGARFVFLYPGSLNWHQGLDVAVRAMASVSKQAPEAELHIYGEGPARKALQDLVLELGLTGKVSLMDSMPMRRIPEIMMNADVGIVPKRKDSFGDEAFSTKILEFMSVGVPVIAADTTIDRYYFNDSVVKFFSSGDATSLAEAMTLLVRNPALREQLAQNALQFVGQFDWEHKKDEYLNLVDSLVLGRNHRHNS